MGRRWRKKETLEGHPDFVSIALKYAEAAQVFWFSASWYFSNPLACKIQICYSYFTLSIFFSIPFSKGLIEIGLYIY